MQPQAAQVSPFLIAVSPVGASVQPQGFVHAPAGARAVLSLSRSRAMSERRKSRGGGNEKETGKRKKLKNPIKNLPPKPALKKYLEQTSTWAPWDTSTAPEEASAADAAAAAAAGESKKGEEVKKLLVSDDPLDLSKDFPNDYRNWAAVLSQVLLTKEGNSADGAKDSLRRLMLAAHGHLAKVAAGEELIPRFHLQDPVLSAASPSASSPFPPLPFFGGKGNAPPSAFPATSATAFASSATFLNYAPCVL